MTKAIDFLGNEIKPGETIVYPGRVGSSLWMNKGVVVDVTLAIDYRGKPYHKVVVEKDVMEDIYTHCESGEVMTRFEYWHSWHTHTPEERKQYKLGQHLTKKRVTLTVIKNIVVI